MMIDRVPGALFALALALPVTAISAQTPTDATLGPKVDSIAAQVLQNTGVPSATVAVIMHGRLAYAKAHGAAKLEPRLAANAR